MEDLGVRIANLRKEQNITQAELGKRLNISAQAVSKWENGLSEPDIETMTKLCEIFNVSLDGLVGKEKPKREEPIDKKKDETDEAAITASATKTAKIPIGVCACCNEQIYDKIVYVTRYENGRDVAYPYCEKCKDKEDLKNNENVYCFNKSEFNRGIFWGVFTGLILFIAVLAYGITVKNYPIAFGASVALLICGFTVVSQILWEGVVSDIFDFFVRSFRMPGLIFELDLDGIIWFITVKLLLGLLSAILSAIVFLIGCVISAVISLFTFPFCCSSVVRELKEDKRKIEILKNKIQGEKYEKNY